MHAVYISEIMYDPQGGNTSRRWVEIYNDTSSAIDLTTATWKFYENKTNHGITSSSDSSLGTSVFSGGYAVIADNPKQFLVDYPSYAGVVYDTTFSLPTSGTDYHIALKESSSASALEISPVDYSPSIGGNNDGSSFSKIDGVWVRGNATPGAINQLYVESSSSSDSSTSSTTTTQATIAQQSPPTADIILYMPTEKVVVAGAEATFSIFGLTHLGKQIENLSYTWAYGDGGQGGGSTTMYRYAYPGRYIASVEGSNGYVAGSGHMNIRVVAPEIAITDVSTGKYGTYIDIENPNLYDLDFSQWRLTINGAIFLFPKNTILAGNSITHISGLAMGFASTTISSSTVIKILFPNQEEITRYSPPQELFPVLTTILATSTLAIARTTQKATSTLISTITIPSIKIKPLTRVLGVSTSTIKNGSITKGNISSTTSGIIQQRKTIVKDTRLVSFFRSFFGKK